MVLQLLSPLFGGILVASQQLAVCSSRAFAEQTNLNMMDNARYDDYFAFYEYKTSKISRDGLGPAQKCMFL